ncbi:MAG: polyprenyl glycosylphosphotransferase, partial [Rhodoferax sp.]|nr:polyprenyl glycosylphosphotransferase [Rhodoferax sp.]
MLVDVGLCFVAVLLAASTLTSRYATIPHAVPELPLVFAGATLFALIMALMYALLGLYRPAPIPVGATVGRIAVALGIGGYLTCLALRA